MSKSFNELMYEASRGRTKCALLVKFTDTFYDYSMWNLENELNSSVASEYCELFVNNEISAPMGNKNNYLAEQYAINMYVHCEFFNKYDPECKFSPNQWRNAYDIELIFPFIDDLTLMDVYYNEG